MVKAPKQDYKFSLKNSFPAFSYSWQNRQDSGSKLASWRLHNNVSSVSQVALLAKLHQTNLLKILKTIKFYGTWVSFGSSALWKMHRNRVLDLVARLGTG